MAKEKYEAVIFESKSMFDIQALVENDLSTFLSLCDKYPINRCIYTIKNKDCDRQWYAAIGIINENGIDKKSLVKCRMILHQNAIKFLKENYKKLKKLVKNNDSMVVYYLTNNYTKEPTIDDYKPFEELEKEIDYGSK